jgi:hypothetical protein
MQPLHSNLDANMSTSKFVDLQPVSHRQQVLKFFVVLFIFVSLFVSFHFLVGLLAMTKDILEFDVSGEAGTSIPVNLVQL